MKTPETKQPSTVVYKRMGIVVKDSYTDLEVEVTPDDIRHAVCRDHQKCVIARAIMRETTAKWVDVGAGIVLIGIDNSHAKRYRLSVMAKEQVRFFDTHDGRAAPCKVQLLAPPPSIRLSFSAGKKHSQKRQGRAVKRREPTR